MAANRNRWISMSHSASFSTCANNLSAPSPPALWATARTSVLSPMVPVQLPPPARVQRIWITSCFSGVWSCWRCPRCGWLQLQSWPSLQDASSKMLALVAAVRGAAALSAERRHSSGGGYALRMHGPTARDHAFVVFFLCSRCKKSARSKLMLMTDFSRHL